jgi:hypothetical protein
MLFADVAGDQSFFNIILVALLTASATVVSQPFLHWIVVLARGPKLDSSFEPDSACIIPAPEYEPIHETIGDAKPYYEKLKLYVRVRVTNKKSRIAEQCRGYLIKVERKTRYEWEPVFADSIPLIWSFDAENATTSIPQGVVKHVDVFTISNDEPGFAPQFRSHNGEVLRLIPFDRAFRCFGTFRFTVVVASQDVAAKTVPFILIRESEEQWPPTFIAGDRLP